MLKLQMRTCSPQDLDCVHNVSVDGDTCLERCQGTIADVIKLNNPVNVEALQETLQQYERYKLPHSVNLTYPSSMKGNRVFYLPTSYNTQLQTSSSETSSSLSGYLSLLQHLTEFRR